MITYKEAWKERILKQLNVKGKECYKLRQYLHKMTGHGLAALSIAIEELNKNKSEIKSDPPLSRSIKSIPNNAPITDEEQESINKHGYINYTC